MLLARAPAVALVAVASLSGQHPFCSFPFTPAHAIGEGRTLHLCVNGLVGWANLTVRRVAALCSLTFGHLLSAALVKQCWQGTLKVFLRCPRVSKKVLSAKLGNYSLSLFLSHKLAGLGFGLVQLLTLFLKPHFSVGTLAGLLFKRRFLALALCVVCCLLHPTN